MRPTRMSVRPSTCAAAVLLAVALVTACARPADEGSAAPTTVVPDLVGRDLATIDKLAAAAGVVPVVEHQPGAAGVPGTVVRVEPPAGTAIALGATITVAVAGAAGGTLDDLVAADRHSFVGLSADPDGTLVIAVATGADTDAALRRIEPALGGREHRLVRCDTTWAELSRVSVEIARRDDLRAAATGYAIAIDAGACAVRVQGDIPAGVVTALRAEYAGAVLVVPGSPARRAVG